MTAAKVVQNYGDEWGLSWYLLWVKNTSILIWTCSLNSGASAEAPISRYPSFEHLWNDQESHPNLHENSHKLQSEKGQFQGKSMKTENNMMKISQWEKS